MKTALFAILFGFGITLALVLIERMAPGTQAVVLGVAVGVAASVPVCIVLLAIISQRKRPAIDGQAQLEDGNR